MTVCKTFTFVIQISDDLKSFAKEDGSEVRVTSVPVVLLLEQEPKTVQNLLHKDGTQQKAVRGDYCNGHWSLITS